MDTESPRAILERNPEYNIAVSHPDKNVRNSVASQLVTTYNQSFTQGVLDILATSPKISIENRIKAGMARLKYVSSEKAGEIACNEDYCLEVRIRAGQKRIEDIGLKGDMWKLFDWVEKRGTYNVQLGVVQAKPGEYRNHVYPDQNRVEAFKFAAEDRIAVGDFKRMMEMESYARNGYETSGALKRLVRKEKYLVRACRVAIEKFEKDGETQGLYSMERQKYLPRKIYHEINAAKTRIAIKAAGGPQGPIDPENRAIAVIRKIGRAVGLGSDKITGTRQRI